MASPNDACPRRIRNTNELSRHDTEQDPTNGSIRESFHPRWRARHPGVRLPCPRGASALYVQRREQTHRRFFSTEHREGECEAHLRDGTRAEIAASPVRRWPALRPRRHRILDQGADRHADDERRQGSLLDTMISRVVSDERWEAG